MRNRCYTRAKIFGGDFMQAGSSSVTAGSISASAPKAGFWIRLLAILIDSILIGIVITAIGAVLNLQPNGRAGLQTLLGIIYYVYFWSTIGPWPGQTLGSKLLNIRVLRTDGNALRISQALSGYIGLLTPVLRDYICVL